MTFSCKLASYISFNLHGLDGVIKGFGILVVYRDWLIMLIFYLLYARYVAVLIKFNYMVMLKIMLKRIRIVLSL